MVDMERIQVVDCWVNPPGRTKVPGDVKQHLWKTERGSIPSSIGYLFEGIGNRIDGASTIEQLLGLMDEAGIGKALLTVDVGTEEPGSLEAVVTALGRYSDRFAGVVKINPLEGMEAVRKLERAVKEFGVKAAKVLAFAVQKPYNDKVYYPVYAKCVELDIPITVNVGIPGPRVPGESQNPIYLDEVCWFFPDLKVVMAHGGEPWQFTCVKLMLKWPNLYYMTSAFAPKHYPAEIIQYMNTRGADKVMFASDFPLLPFDRCMREVKELPLRDHVWSRFLNENATRVFKLKE